MKEYRGIDISGYNYVTNFESVKNNGVRFAILKIMRKDLAVDKGFKSSYEDFNRVGVSVKGVYTYSYATTVTQAKNYARRVVELLEEYTVPKSVVVWLDIEDKCQQNLGRYLIQIINAYYSIIDDAGYKVGLYTGLSFYKSYISAYTNDLKIPTTDLWIARYYKGNESMTIDSELNENYKPLKPIAIAGWQYSSSGVVPGINGKVDLDVMYIDEFSVDTGDAKIINPYPEPTNSIYYGATGDKVKWIQFALNNIGFGYKLDIDGKYGPLTRRAVIDFQNRSGLVPDAIVGPLTKASLKHAFGLATIK